jgi:alpha-tubulin suppressor-like RCC1 family protein
MRSLIDKLEEEGGLKNGYATLLESHLKNAEKFSDRGDTEKAITFYHHMIGHIEDWFEKEVITKGVREDLIGCLDDLLGLSSFRQISAGGGHTCALTGVGVAFCWGSNSSGQLGDGTTMDRHSPVAVAGGLTFSAISAGLLHTCALTALGDAYCWGDNFTGELGDGTRTGRFTPVAVAGGLTFSAISAGFSHTCAVTTLGDAYCWGANLRGQLGNPDRRSPEDDRLTPTAVVGDITFSAIEVGGGLSCGLTPGGDVYCWGGNDEGLLYGHNPFAVPGGLSFSDVATGEEHVCGISLGGDAYCWGENGTGPGQLGDGTNFDSFHPVAVIGGLTFSAISAGGDHTCGLTPGKSYCWGRNADGQLGDGTTTGRLTPDSVTGGFTFSAISAGGAHTCALTTGGVAYCWGANSSGQLGDGTITDRSTPVAVAFS